MRFGTIATGDSFIGAVAKKTQLRRDFGAHACEMEGAAVAQVCRELGVPFLVVRGLPVLFTYRNVLGGRERWALGIVQATALPLVVVITQIGIETNRMKPENAAALVGAGMLSVLIFPLVGFGLLDKARTEPVSEEPGEAIDPQAMDAPPLLIDDDPPYDER